MDIETLVSQLPENQREPARKIIPSIAKALDAEGILTPRVLSYAIATAGHESGFVPKEEIMASRGVNARNNRIADLQDNYEGGKQFRGRGLIQLTHKGNYEKYGQRIGEDLVKNPERLLDPEVSAKVLAAYFKDSGVADAAEQGDYTRARVLVQGRGATSPDFIQTTNDIGKQASTLTKSVSDPKAFLPKESSPTQGTLPAQTDLTPSQTSTSAQLSQRPEGLFPTQPPAASIGAQPGSVPLDNRLTPTTDQPYSLQQISRPYGEKMDPRLRFSQGYGSRPQVYGFANLSGHEGFDYIVDENTPLHSPISGTVERVGDPNNPILKRSYGNYVFIRGDDGSGLLLGHNNRVDVKPGQQIKTGDQIGLTGKTGFSEAPHIHASWAPKAEVALESLEHFEKTGAHKIRGGGFADPSKVTTNEYANRFIQPKNLVPEGQVTQAQPASPSSGVAQAIQNPTTKLDDQVRKAIEKSQEIQPNVVQKTIQGVGNVVQNVLQKPKEIVQSLVSSPQPQSTLPKMGDRSTQLTEGMKSPLSFSLDPSSLLETPKNLQLTSQKQPERPNLPAPSFDVGSRPQTKVSTSQSFSPGFSQQVGGLTQSFSDTVKQSFATPETPQQQQQAQQSKDPGVQNQTPNYSQAQQAGAKTKALQSKQKQSQPVAQPSQNFSGGIASKPASFAASSVQRATPITSVNKPTTYTVQKGDTLWGIAQKTTGSGANYKQLGYKGDPKKLQVGTKLTIPRPR